jgi:hypothetical protein
VNQSTTSSVNGYCDIQAGMTIIAAGRRFTGSLPQESHNLVIGQTPR